MRSYSPLRISSDAHSRGSPPGSSACRSAISSALGREALVRGVLLVLVAAAFVLGGSARADVASLAILRPLGLLCLALALGTLSRTHARGFVVPLAIAGAAVLLPALQLVPLPPSIWQRLPDRDLVAEIDRAAGLGTPWRPLTLTPPETLNALLAGVIPLAVMLLAIQLRPEQRADLVTVVLALGAGSAVLGLLQLLGDPQGPFYLYTITNNGAAVGLFANRNHQAVALACLLPLAFAAANLTPLTRMCLASIPSWRMPAAIAAAGLLVPLILVTGSRAGLIALAIALVSLPFLVPSGIHGGARMTSPAWLWLAGLTITGIAITAVWLGRDEALDRLAASTPTDETRVQILPTLQDMIMQHWLWGTGLGSFERAYQVHEPATLLMQVYMNHAHNDWLELAITGGVAALAILFAALVAIARRGMHVLTWKDADPWQPLRRAALVIIVILGFASLSDYPLRTPSLAVLCALCVVWLFLPAWEPSWRGTTGPASVGRA